MFKNLSIQHGLLAPGVLALFLALFSTVNADELKTFSSPEHGLSFSYSKELTPETVDLPQSVIALKGNDQGYPSFNVLVSAENYDPKGYNEGSYRDKVLNDYRLVGITDAKSVRTYQSPVADLLVFTTEMRYQFKGETLLSAVTLIPAGENKHFILTYIDLGEHFYRRKRTREDIINSLKVGLVGGNILDGTNETLFGGEINSSYWAKLALLVIAGCLLIMALFKLRAKS